MAGATTRGFLFADLRGYTAYVERHGDLDAAALLSTYRMLVRARVAEHDGAEIRTEGDSFYVVFPSASSAVTCGLAILAAAAADAAPTGGAIAVGVGVHAGESVETSEGYVGSAVNIAARLCALARPGEMLVSDTVRSLTRTSLQVTFVPRGTRRLKGIDEPIAVYRAMVRREASARRRSQPRRLPVIGLVVAAILVATIAGLGGAVLFGRTAPSSSPPGRSVAALASLPPVNRLLARIPSWIRSGCTEASGAERTSTATLTIRCDLAPESGASRVFFDEFRDEEDLRDAMSDVVSTEGIPTGDCAREAPAAGEWELGDTYRGEILCYVDDGGVWLVWSYEGEALLGRAARTDPSVAPLYEWWRETGPFLH
jgi:class 3 adenylate cyclase